RSGAGAPVVRVRDVAEVVQTYKEPFAIVRSLGHRALAINAQREVGSNVMRVMDEFKQAIAYLDNDVLPDKARSLGLDGELRLRQVYDQTVYITDAIGLVRSNLFIGGSLAVLVLLVFLRSFKFTLVVALAIPISVIGTFVAMVGMGRNINVISLAGLAFAVGMVVDNAIVVLENIDRHRRGLREGAFHSAYTGAKEVWGAVLAATMTTLAVFIPVLLVQEEAGQLFRDISLAICAAVTLSLLVSVMVIPVGASRLLQRDERRAADEKRRHGCRHAFESLFGLAALAGRFADRVADTVGWLCRSWAARLTIAASLTLLAIGGAATLMPQASYLPAGNRNLVFGLLIPPPGYNLKKMEQIGLRIEDTVSPYWQAPGDPNAAAELRPVPMRDPATGQMRMVHDPPGVRQFFFVGLNTGLMFTGAISGDDSRVDPIGALLNSAITDQPGIFGFAKKRSLFQTGGSDTGIELELSGPDLEAVNGAASAVFMQLINDPRFGARAVQPDPGNFMIPGEEINVDIDMVRASDLGLSNRDLGRFVQMLGDGAIIDDHVYRGDSIDLTLIDHHALRNNAGYLRDVPLHTPAGETVPLGSVADIRRATAPQQIKRIERQRAVSLNVEVPKGMPLERAERIIRAEMIGPLKDAGQIAPSVKTFMAGSAAKLTEVKRALLGEWTGLNFGSLKSLFTSRAFLALLVVFLVMAALFESWFYPLVIMFTVPLATVGGFLGLRLVNIWTGMQPFVETQQLDLLSMLGFVILTGVVVNNAILIVHQALNFVRGRGEADESGRALDPQDAIRESVRTRVRPIFMSMCTSAGGMLPLVIFSGAGSELYRGLGSVVVGGLVLSAVFTLILTPVILSMVFAIFPPQRQRMATTA
ncbi:MAG: efflux RND transporter permease subunit, partial [Phycisphaerae bacterium]|nr:efflux RND transporter permease subunit [Phycisphaerae bacterium]